MGKLYLYSIFHSNLFFSSIPENHILKVIDKCYWPIIDIAESFDFYPGLEFSGYTLEILQKKDPIFIKKLKELANNKKIEIIFSGYQQIIMPLFPSGLNRRNIELGKVIFERILGFVPDCCFLPEQTFSKSLVNLYKDFGFKTLIMDFDNANEYNHYANEIKYQPNILNGLNDCKINLLWNSSLASFKFQRCIHNRISVKEYVDSLKEHIGKTDRSFALYGTDWEVFNYRPYTGDFSSQEDKKIEAVYKTIKETITEAEYALPSEVADKIPARREITVETPQCPIPCKNRDEYNVTRWALTGPDTADINTACYDFLNKINHFQTPGLNDYKELLILASSDFRTKTIHEKTRLKNFLYGHIRDFTAEKLKQDHVKNSIINKNNFDWKYPVLIKKFFKPGKFYKKFDCVINGEKTEIQFLNCEFYRDCSIKYAEFIIVPKIKKNNIALIQYKETRQKFKNIEYKPATAEKIKTRGIKLTLGLQTGADIRELRFNKTPAAVGYISPAYFDNIAYSKDYYSGGIHLRDSQKNNFNDTVPARLYKLTGSDETICSVYKAELNMGGVKIIKEFLVYNDFSRVDFNYNIKTQGISAEFLRAGIFTVHPDYFKKKNLKMIVNNGYEEPEEFKLANTSLSQHTGVEFESTTKHCLGATEGFIGFTDGAKHLFFCQNKKINYTAPLIQYEEIKKNFLLRIFNSMAETDETGSRLLRGYYDLNYSVIGGSGEFSDYLTAAKSVSNTPEVI